MRSAADATARTCDLLVIGAGFCGRMLVAQLLRQAALPRRTLLLDPHLNDGVGRAWTDASGLWSANVPAGNLSAWADDPGHFLRWWSARRGVPEADLAAAFAPRALYGEYLQAQLSESLAAATTDGQLQLGAASAQSLQVDGGGWRVSLADDSVVWAQTVVLATGFGSAGAVSRGLRHAHDPLHGDCLSGLSSSARVLLVGTGLTAVDALQKLAAAGHHGPVTLLSRHALLPSAHAELAAPRRTWTAQELGTSVRSAVRAVRVALEEMQCSGGDWRSVIDGLRPHNNSTWRSWDQVQRARFVRHVRAWWDVHRHRAAGDVLAQVHEYLAMHDVQRHAGFLEAIEPVDEGLLARWRVRGSTRVMSQCFDRVLDATSKRPLDVPLIAQLQSAGVLAADRLRLGLCCDDAGLALDPQGRRLQGLYLLGPLLHARDWESTAVPELRMQVQTLAQLIGTQTHD